MSQSNGASSAKKGRADAMRMLKTWLRRLLMLAIVGGLVAAVVVAMAPQPLPVDVASVRRGSLRVTIDEDGRTRVKDRFVVGAPLMGNVARIDLHPADVVHQGDVLARIVPLAPPLLDARSRAEAEGRVSAAVAQQRQARASIDRARIAVEFAEGEARRVAQLAASGGASAQAVERAQMEQRTAREELTSLEFGARVADHQVQIARAALGRLSTRATAEEAEQMDVSSPVDGIVLRVAQESEGVVQVGAPLMELGDPAALEIVVDVLTSDAVRIERGAHVEIDRWGGALLRGHVRLVEPSAFTRTSALGVEEQRVNVLVDLDSPREEWISLGDGYRVEARIVVWEAEDVVIVPASAVFRRGEGSAVFVIEGDHARLTPIEVGHGNGLDIEVVSGLDEGATVIVHPGDTVDDGVLVAPRR